MHAAAMTPKKGGRAWSGWTVPSLRATLSTTNFMQIAKPSMAPRNIPRNPPRHVPASRTDSLSLINLWKRHIVTWAPPFEILGNRGRRDFGGQVTLSPLIRPDLGEDGASQIG